jgi:(1->4)-alpha-D-glucan 1-alpha-D-glucosylmutase
MASELNALSRAAARLAAQGPMTADLTRGILHRALKQVVASFPVYRTYVDLDGSMDQADRRDLEWALAIARRSHPDIHPSAFDFVRDLFLPDAVEATPRESSRTACLRLAMKIQQYSSPVMAKGVEDTAFYRYNRLIALNEVGGAPDRFGISLAAFHKANAHAAEKWPHQMVATSTHDTKRGEDARARLAVLSELPDEWRRMVFTWSKILHARKGDVEGEAPPDRNDEYMFYQMLVGSWPSELLRAPDPAGLMAYAARVQAALQKSLREGKHRSNWASPNAAYEDAMRAFAAEALDPHSGGFLGSFLPFAERVATLGVQNSVAQLAMKMTLPGAPDIYQGSESWNLSMVDPDNRRPIDYRKLKDMAAELSPRLTSVKERAVLFTDLLGSWPDGRIKMAVTLLLLGLRRRRESFFADAGYEPIPIRGDNSDWALGYVRVGGNRRLAVLIARFPGLREANSGWCATAALPQGPWTDLVFGRKIQLNGETSLRELLDPLPFAVLESAG